MWLTFYVIKGDVNFLVFQFSTKYNTVTDKYYQENIQNVDDVSTLFLAKNGCKSTKAPKTHDRKHEQKHDRNSSHEKSWTVKKLQNYNIIW